MSHWIWVMPWSFLPRSWGDPNETAAVRRRFWLKNLMDRQNSHKLYVSGQAHPKWRWFSKGINPQNCPTISGFGIIGQFAQMFVFWDDNLMFRHIRFVDLEHDSQKKSAANKCKNSSSGGLEVIFWIHDDT